MRSLASLVLALTVAAGCGGDDLDSDAEARRAYLGFDRAVDLGLELGLDGFNAATSANIPDQTGDGADSGTLTVSGQVDQGASANKEMRLLLTLVDYSDGPLEDPETDDTFAIVYDSPPEAPPALDLSLRDIPDGTFSGTISGRFLLSGDLDTEATFALTLSGGIQEDPQRPGEVIREPGTLRITGTATSGDGTYTVDVSR